MLVYRDRVSDVTGQLCQYSVTGSVLSGQLCQYNVIGSVLGQVSYVSIA